MSIVRSIRSKLLGLDPAYADIAASRVPLYQHFFDKVLEAVDLDTQTNWGLSRPYDIERFRTDEEAMEQIIAGEARVNGLHPATLQVMVTQYFLADARQREQDRHHWAHRVIHRRAVDYFPAAKAVLALLHRDRS